MRYQANTENIHPDGTLIRAKENPSVQLKIMKYYGQIYYCAIVGDEERKQLVYFARELMLPDKV